MLRCAASAPAVVRTDEFLNAIARRPRTKSTVGKPAAASADEKTPMSAAPTRPAAMAFERETTRIIGVETRSDGQIVAAKSHSFALGTSAPAFAGCSSCAVAVGPGRILVAGF